jgi:CheY-like chemotaxis protein
VPGWGDIVRILLAEDSSDIHILLRHYLERAGHEVEVVENGDLAVRAWFLRRFELILMDLDMPVMDGFAATRAIRRIERERNLTAPTIVALTAHGSDAEPEALEQGCNACLAKPIGPADLLALVERIQTGGEAPPPPAPAPAPPPAPASTGDRVRVVVDPDLKEFIPSFFENRRQEIERLKNALDQGDLDTVRRLGHGLKGKGTGYGFADITTIGAGLEVAAKGGDVSGVRKAIDDLASYLDRVDITYG